MAVYICVELQSINGLPDIMNCLLERSIKFTVSKDRNSLCDRCSAREELAQPPGSSYLQQLPHISTPSSASLELMDAYPRSESVDSEPNDNVKAEASASMFREPTPVKDEIEEADLVACGSELLQQVSANFASYQEKNKTGFTDSEAALVREKGTASAPKQCQERRAAQGDRDARAKVLPAQKSFLHLRRGHIEAVCSTCPLYIILQQLVR
ncbi:hypothetical protein ANCDUO_10468 [Ancylostoma duodenale]|uniref:Uncharacterized protein n=1 Tax=Ancylostoma duodenale TaxID=51022 RepID=A0A0C2DAE8_9BILA|nr:hypothetical protein ANCDUO_10468 [Ancylostoma duodenale]